MKPSQDSYTNSLSRNHRWNAVVNTVDAVFFQIGFACFVPGVILVSYLRHFTQDQMVLNLPILVSNFLMTLGPFVMSFFASRFQTKKRAMLVTAFLHRASFIPVVLVVWLYGDSPQVVTPFLLAFGLFYTCWGISTLFWQEMIGRVFAPDRINSAMGLRESVSRIAGFLASFGVLTVLDTVAFPNNFVALFGAAFFLWMLSGLAMTQFREAQYVDAPPARDSSHWRNLWDLPKNDPGLRWYVVFILFAYGFNLVGGLYTVTGLQRFAAVGADQLTGTINTVTVFASAVFAFLSGRVSDRFGKFWGFFLLCAATLLLNVGMIFVTDYWAYLVLVLLSGVTYVMWVLELTTVLGFTTPEGRHEYLAFTSIVKLVPILVYTNLGGFLANTAGSTCVFAVAAVFSAGALVVLTFGLRRYLK